MEMLFVGHLCNMIVCLCELSVWDLLASVYCCLGMLVEACMDMEIFGRDENE